MLPTSPLDVVAAALFTYGAHSAVACALALAMGRALRRPQDREIVWKVCVVAPILTSMVVLAVALAGNRGPLVDLARVVRRSTAIALPPRIVTVNVVQQNDERSVSRKVHDPVTTVISLSTVLAAGCCVSLAMARLVHRRWRRRRMLSARTLARPITTPAGMVARVFVVDNLPSPVAMGRTTIALPAVVANDFDAAHRNALVAHEIAHLERGDPAWLLAAEVISAVSAFQPLLPRVMRAFRHDVELICDERAVRQTGEPGALIAALALLASPFDPRAPLDAMHGAATAHDGSPLVARADRIASLSRSAVWRGAGTLSVLTAAALIGALFAVPAVSAFGRESDLSSTGPGMTRHIRVAGWVLGPGAISDR